MDCVKEGRLDPPDSPDIDDGSRGSIDCDACAICCDTFDGEGMGFDMVAVDGSDGSDVVDVAADSCCSRCCFELDVPPSRAGFEKSFILDSFFSFSFSTGTGLGIAASAAAPAALN